MPRNQKEGIIYGIIICGIMVYFMGLMNISIHMNGLTRETLWIATKSFPVIFVIAMVLENLFVGKVARLFVAKLIPQTDSPNARILFMSFFIVTGMSLCMSLVGGILSSGLNSSVLTAFPETWPRNFCVAMFWQLLVAGPLARKALQLMRKLQGEIVETV
jgi:hypothetical protein